MAKKIIVEEEKDMELYENQKINNERLFDEMLRNHRPDIWVIKDMLDRTGLNSTILFHYLRHLNNIALGNGWGEVRTFIENGVVKFIKGEESSRIEEPLLVKKDE